MTAQANILKPSRTGDVGRGALALVALALLVVAVPVALVAWAPSPLPSEVPSPSEVADAVRDTYIPDDLLVGALALVCWLVWAELVVSLVVEAMACARGRKAGAVPLAGGVQRAAARLVAAVALLGALAATRSTPAPMAMADGPLIAATDAPLAVVVDDPAVAGPGVAGAPAGDVAEPDPEPAPVYEVQRRDTLWDIAERHLGDPFRWREIFGLNEGCVQPDGRCLTDPDLIHAGWQLELPADAVGLAPPPAPAAAPDQPAPEPAGDAGGSHAGGTEDGGTEDGGMVLVDDDGVDGGGVDGGRKAVGGVVLAGQAGSTATEPRRPVDGMVLLPDRPAADDIEEQGVPLRLTDTDQ